MDSSMCNVKNTCSFYPSREIKIALTFFINEATSSFVWIVADMQHKENDVVYN